MECQNISTPGDHWTHKLWGASSDFPALPKGNKPCAVTLRWFWTNQRSVATLSVLPINLPPDDIKINIAPDIPQIYESNNKTITPNFEGFHVKDDQGTVTVSPVVKVPVELQHPSDLLKLEDDLKHVKEDKDCIPLKKTDPIVVVPENVPKEVKRRAHEKRRTRIKENKNYYFIPKRRQKENSVAYCDQRVLVNPKRRRKEDVSLKTYHIDHLGPHRITEFEEGVMEQTVRFEPDLL
ncbi:hypothetical protein TNCV_3410271 [Trichonephila clavipes]|nr:hypothetical protein TNCV_3410271 [Trichonephila clavipes]